MNPAPTLASARKQGREQLAATSPSAGLDADCLLAQATGLTRVDFFAHPDRALTASAWHSYQVLLERRATGEPVAYLLGEREFMDFTLAVDQDVLIPRPETEHLVEAALREPAERVLDLGTGSGCVAIALARAWPRATIDAVDQSAAALAIAQRNAQSLGVSHIQFYQGDWYTPIGTQRYALIVSNPPYIGAHEPEPNQGDARFEPPQALRSGGDGLAALSTIIRNASAHLTQNGRLWVEHGYRQGPAVRALLEQAGFGQIQTEPDLAGHERISGGIKESLL